MSQFPHLSVALFTGSVLARRLSEKWRVLLLEGGTVDTDTWAAVKTPALFWRLQGSDVDWNYTTVKQYNACQGNVSLIKQFCYYFYSLNSTLITKV